MEQKPKPNMSRRGFISGLLGTAGAATILGSIPNVAKSKENELQKKITITPDYLKRATEIDVSISELMTEYELKTILGLLNSLPEYCKIRVFVEKTDDAKDIVENLLSRIKSDEKRKNMVSVTKEGISTWIQDSGEYINIDGKNVFLSPKISDIEHDPVELKQPNHFIDNVLSSREALKNYEEIVIAPFYFEGGDITSAQNPAGENFIFMGQACMLKNIEILRKKTENKNKTLQELIEIYKTTVQDFFGETKVVHIPPVNSIDKPKSVTTPLMYHLDQSILPLVNGRIAVATVAENQKNMAIIVAKDKIEYISKIKIRQEETIKILKDLGFETIEVPHTYSDINYNFYLLNCIPFVNGNKHPEIILPAYGHDVIIDKVKDKIIFEKEDFQLDSETKKFAILLENLGYKVTIVWDPSAHFNAGSIHCKTAVKS